MNIYHSFLVILLSIIIIFIPSCKKATKYRDDLSCKFISEEMYGEIDSSLEYTSYSDEDVRLLFDDTSLFDDCSIIYSNDANDINEIGVFHCQNEKSTKELLSAVKNYISEQQENMSAFIASYAPRELPKLDAAEVKRYGNYVIYAILDQNAQEEAFDEAIDILEIS